MRLGLVGILFCVALIFEARGQSPQGINYQGVARDSEGKPLVSQDISVRISILKDGATGETEFAETHAIKTNSFGLFMLVIGQGQATTGSFQFISWAIGNKWLQIELDPAGGNSFQLLGSQQLMSVPYAFYSTYSGNGLTAGQGIKIQNNQIINSGDTDSNSSNEVITDVRFETDKKLRITEAGVTREVDLSPLTGAGQNLSEVLAMGNNAGGQKIENLAAPTLATDAATKLYVDSHTDADSDASNEIQDLTKTGNTLSLSGDASTIDLTPYLDNTDNQALLLTGTTLSLTNSATSINLSPFMDNTDNQDLSLTGNTLSLTNDATSVNLSPYLDNTDSQTLSAQSVDANTRSIAITGGNTLTIDVRDADASPTNEIQDLSLSGHTLSLSSDATTVNLATYLDNTDSQTLSAQSVDANTRSIAITGGNTLNVDVRDADASPTNEIQDLSLNANTLSLSGDGTTVSLASYLDNTDNQDLTLSGNTLSLTNDATSVNLSAYLDNTDSQTLSAQSVDANTRSIAITGGNTLNVDVRDADANPTNEIQDLSLNANTLSLSGDGTTVSLASYLDNTDNQDLTLTGNTLGLTNDASPVNLAPYLQTLTYTGSTNTLSISGGNNVAITTTLNQVLSTSTDANAHSITNLATPTNNNDAATKKYVDDADALLSSRISTTYAFKSVFAYSNTSGSTVNDQQLPFTTEEFDDFNIVGGSSFTASENGVYVFIVDGSYSAAFSGGQLSLLYNSVKYSIAIVQPWGAALAKFNATLMFKLTAGQTVRLVGDNIPANGQFTGSFFGYKL